MKVKCKSCSFKGTFVTYLKHLCMSEKSIKKEFLKNKDKIDILKVEAKVLQEDARELQIQNKQISGANIEIEVLKRKYARNKE